MTAREIVPVGGIGEFVFAMPGPDYVWVEVLEIDGNSSRVYDPWFNLEFWTESRKVAPLKIKPEKVGVTRAKISEMKAGAFDDLFITFYLES